MRPDLEALLPQLGGTLYIPTSLPTIQYNCIAWAAGDDTKWWQPEGKYYYWPPGVPRQKTIKAYVAAYASLGYVECNDGTLESELEKVAIYARNGVPQHAARQLESGLWTSKLGVRDDISHTLEALEHSEYGQVAVFMCRPKQSP